MDAAWEDGEVEGMEGRGGEDVVVVIGEGERDEC